MISTATAAVNAAPAGSPSSQPAASVSDGDHDDDRHEDGGDAVGQPLHRRLAGLRVGHEPADLGELGVGADPGGAHDEPAAGVDGRPGDARRPRPTSTGTDSPVSIEASTAELPVVDHAVGGDLLARPHDEPSPTASWSDRDPLSRRRRAAPRRPWRRVRAAPAAQRRPAAWPAPRVAPGQHEHGHPGGDLEVDVASLGARASKLKPCAHPSAPACRRTARTATTGRRH